MTKLAIFMYLVVTVIGATSISIEPADAGPDHKATLGLPVDCRLGEDCFLQQFPDMDPTDRVRDPLCGADSYQGHNGTDIRIRSLSDIADNVAVIAATDGIVLRVRDGVPDRILDAKRDRALVAQEECGNGLVLSHANGIETQYCHLKQGSLTLRPGASVKKGQRIGSIGSSGLAEFPHLHFVVRHKGVIVEPLTGQPLAAGAEGCGNFSDSYFEESARNELAHAPAAILATGLSNAPPQLDGMVRDGPPATARANEGLIVAWIWAINLPPASRFRIAVIRGDKAVVIDDITTPLDQRKANYLVYVGRKRAIEAGTYTLAVELLGTAQVTKKSSTISVR